MANAGPVDPGLVNDDFASLPASQPVAFANPAAAIGQAARITCRIYHPASGQTVVESNVIVPLLASRRRRAHDSSTDSSSSDDDDEDGDDDQMNDNDHPPTNKRAYWIQRTIRKAIYGKVKMGVVLRARNVVSTSNTPEAEWEVTSEPCAIKEMEWSRIRSARGRLAENPIGEVGALHYMQQLTKDQQQNPQHVLVPLDLLSDDQFLYLISPFCNGGELFDLLENREKFTEVEARYWMKQVLLGIGELQAMGLCHRDLSLENCMVHDQTSLVIDFGMCFRVPFNNQRQRLLVEPSGTMGKWHYMSPEIVRNREPFDPYAIDLWAAGVILFLMLTGFPPWEKADDTDDRFKYMSRGYMVQLLREWNLGLSSEAMDLLQSMLYKDPRRRLSLRQVWQHPWIQIQDSVQLGAVTNERPPWA